MNGSIRFNDDINIEVAVDPTAAEGARLVSATNLVDGQGIGDGGGLPDVSPADEGKVLAVNAGGEWAAESVMINYDADDDAIDASYNQLKNMMEHNQIPYITYLRQSGDMNEICLYRLSSIYSHSSGYTAVFGTFSNSVDDYSSLYFGNASADGSPMIGD